MTWKPTEEMVRKADKSFAKGGWRQNIERTTAALIAVQPLIAAEATAPLTAEIARLRGELAATEARVLEEAAKYAYDFHTGSGYVIAEHLRSLIPKDKQP